MSQPISEPPLQTEDTSPIKPIARPKPNWLLLLAALLSLGTIALLLWPSAPVPAPIIVAAVTTNTVIPTESSNPLQAIPTIETVAVGINSALPPIVPAQQLNAVLQLPLNPNDLMSYRYQAFTSVNNQRPRTDFVDYFAVSGDTIDAIAERYNLKSESIAWCNERRIIEVLRPNDLVRIPPMDGACHHVLATLEETIASLALQYKVEDPYSIIDSPVNYGQLPSNISPDDILAGGINLFIPNGQGTVITWNAATFQTDANGNVTGLSFGAGENGTCGTVSPSGGTFWGNPLPNGTWVRGFDGVHSGLDLAAPTGTPIYAANSGQVIFSGFSHWGYGEAVVIEHGNTFSTLYGHMSARNVQCGQSVVTGQVIGYVGSTGDSTGPHLHFEIQVNGQALDPSGTAGIGW